MISSLYRSDKADIYVHFEPGAYPEHRPGLPRFAPGDTISGTVEITPSETIRYKKLIVRIQWRTEGRGDTDEVVWTSIEEPEGVLSAGVIKSVPFSTILPSEPWSYAGRYIAIVWGVDFEIDIAPQTNPHFFAPFLLAPTWI